MSLERLGVIGAGAFGTALARLASLGGRDTLLWARSPELAASINRDGENRPYLPGRQLGAAVRATSDLAELDSCAAWLLVTPAQHMRAVLAAAPARPRPLILCAKGIEEASGKLLHAVAAETMPGATIGVLSGPSFADEVAAGLPTAVTLASTDAGFAEEARARLAGGSFRIYVTDDVCGAEIGGAVKNVLAIACGVVAGRGLGESSRAAIIARGFAEMTRFGLAFGARRETLTGLSGLGDLVLTCSSIRSRNFSLGFGIGQGRPAAELLADRRTVAEGAFTAPVLCRLAQQKGIDMPIVAAVVELLAGRAQVDSVLEKLMARPPRLESA